MMDHHPRTAATYYAKLGGAKSKAVFETRFRRFGEKDLNRDPEQNDDLDNAVENIVRDLEEKRTNGKKRKE